MQLFIPFSVFNREDGGENLSEDNHFSVLIGILFTIYLRCFLSGPRVHVLVHPEGRGLG